LYAKRSFGQTSDGFQYQDSFKIVIENIAEFDQTTQINRLRQEFWEYPKRLGWKIPTHVLSSVLGTYDNNSGSSNSNSNTNGSNNSGSSGNTGGASHSGSNEGDSGSSGNSGSSGSPEINFAVPSDSVHGNPLEAINMALNILSKHYEDRDLVRTNNSIVMITAGTGIFKVKPGLNQITKQRMLDNAFGLDCISLARPIVDTVPLFLVDCRSEGVKNFYEMPHWMHISYIDCKKEIRFVKSLSSFLHNCSS
jgi:hypothetical protein